MLGLTESCQQAIKVAISLASSPDRMSIFRRFLVAKHEPVRNLDELDGGFLFSWKKKLIFLIKDHFQDYFQDFAYRASNNHGWFGIVV